MRRERLKAWKDFLEKNRGMVAYGFGAAGLLCVLVGWGLLPDQVSANPGVENMVLRPKGFMLALHAGMLAFFTLMVWRRPRELAYLTGAILSMALFLMLLFTNLGV